MTVCAGVLAGVLCGRLAGEASSGLQTGLLCGWGACCVLAFFCLLLAKKNKPAVLTGGECLPQGHSENSDSLDQTSSRFPWLLPVEQRWADGRFLSLLVCAFFFLGFWQGVRNDRTLREEEATFRALPQRPEISVRLTEVPEHSLSDEDEGYWQAAGILTRVNDEYVTLPVLVSGFGERPQQRATVWNGRAYERKIKPAAWAGAFDLREYLRRRGLCGALQFTDGYQQDETVARTGLLWRVDRLRGSLVTGLLQALPDQRGAFLAAALFGYRKQLSEATRQDFQQAGVGHVLAISGLHVGMVAAILWFLVSRGIADRRIVAGLCIAGCIAYVILSGGRVAAVRAGIMTCMYLGGFLICRRSDLTNSLAGAAMILMLLNPLVVADMGFLLSFVAVMFIERGVKFSSALLDWMQTTKTGVKKKLTPVRRFVRWAVALLISCVFAWLGVMPLSVMAFGQAAPAGLLVNLFVMPWTTVVLAAGIGAQAAALVHLPASLVNLLAMPSQILLWILSHVRGLPDWISARPDSGWVAVYYLGFACLLIPLGKPGSWLKRGRIVLGVIAAGVGLVQVMGATSVLSGKPVVTLLPGGRMDGIVWTKPAGEAVLFAPDKFTERDAERYLRQNGMRPQFSSVVRLVSKETLLSETVVHSPSKNNVVEILWKQEGVFYQRVALAEGALEIRRGRDGKITWVSLWVSATDREPASMVVVSPRVWPGQILYRMDKLSELEKDALRLVSWQLATTKKNEENELAAAAATNDSTMILLNRKPEQDQAWTDRRQFGAVQVYDLGSDTGKATVLGYDGCDWKGLAP